MFCIEDACERERIRNGLAPLGSSRVASKKRLSAWGVGGGLLHARSSRLYKNLQIKTQIILTTLTPCEIAKCNFCLVAKEKKNIQSIKITNISSLLPDSVVLFVKTFRSCFQNVSQSFLQCQGLKLTRYVLIPT